MQDLRIEILRLLTITRAVTAFRARNDKPRLNPSENPGSACNRALYGDFSAPSDSLIWEKQTSPVGACFSGTNDPV